MKRLKIYKKDLTIDRKRLEISTEYDMLTSVELFFCHLWDEKDTRGQKMSLQFE